MLFITFVYFYFNIITRTVYSLSVLAAAWKGNSSSREAAVRQEPGSSVPNQTETNGGAEFVTMVTACLPPVYPANACVYVNNRQKASLCRR